MKTPDTVPWPGSTIEDELPVSELGVPLQTLPFEARYEPEELLGEGGMGTVRLYRDRQMGRRVAMKTLRSEHRGRSAAEVRFVREARVQGQLEHPSIVPVHDLGLDPAGASYFIMKRIRGVDLDSIVTRLAKGDAGFLERYSRRRLLTAFSQVCLTVDFAHRRGVLHRDLKPANVMLGEFGEVYVLDWGLAKVYGAGTMVDEATDPAGLDPLPGMAPTLQTKFGTILGTPGYIAPEQVRGMAGALAPTADVYALGAILFELLAWEPLHERHSLAGLIASTVQGAEARLSLRAPARDVPPELEEICVKATATDPVDRHASARELQEAIERFLDGERDVERRRELAAAHAQEAMASARRIAGNPEATLAERSHAMQQIGRALALDPGNGRALDAMVQVLTTPAAELPDAVAAEMAETRRARFRWVGRVGAIAYASMLLYLPLFLWCGVRDWTPIILFYAMAAVAGGASLMVARMPSPSETLSLIPMVASAALCASSAALFGPLVLTPMVVAVNAGAFALHLGPRYRVAAAMVGSLAVLVPFGLQVIGAVPMSYAFVPEGILIRPQAIWFPEIPSLVFLVLGAIAGVITATVSVVWMRDHLISAERRLYLYTWHLRQLAPSRASP